MIILLASAIFATMASDSQRTWQFPKRTVEHTILVGWHDEMDARSHWGPLNMENRAFVATPFKNTIFLGLDQVPPNWPYQFQWSGVTQDAYDDLARFPILMARVSQVQGYAHLDIDVIGPKGNVANTVRSNALNDPGLTQIDLGKALSPDTSHFRIRLIVGGPNSGCCATYTWIRFVSRRDAMFLGDHPDWRRVYLYNQMRQ